MFFNELNVPIRAVGQWCQGRTLLISWLDQSGHVTQTCHFPDLTLTPTAIQYGNLIRAWSRARERRRIREKKKRKERKEKIYHSAYAKYCLIKVHPDYKYFSKSVYSKTKKKMTLMKISIIKPYYYYSSY